MTAPRGLVKSTPRRRLTLLWACREFQNGLGLAALGPWRRILALALPTTTGTSARIGYLVAESHACHTYVVRHATQEQCYDTCLFRRKIAARETTYYY